MDAMDEGNQKDIYLCFNTADREWTRNLAAQLESETIDGHPTSRKLTVFFDEWDIDSGENLIKRMNQGLQSSRFVAVVLSPEFMKAPWPAFEWTHIVSLDPINDQKRLIPLLRRDVSLDGKEKIALPAPFRALRYIDFRNPAQANTKYAEFVRRIRGLPLRRGAPRTPLAGISPSLVGDEPEESWLPDKVLDVLLGNLLPIASLPRTIWSAETAARKKDEVVAQVEHAEGFILQDKRLYTFADLTVSGTALRSIVDTKTVQTASRHEWFIHPDRSRWLMNLLNRYLAGYWLVLERATGRPVGQAGLLNLQVDDREEIGLGYIIHRPYWRRGFAFEAATGSLNHAVTKLGRNRVVALVRPENLPSQAVARKLGMEVEKRTHHADYAHLVFVTRFDTASR